MAEAIQCNTSRFFATRKIPSTMIVYRMMKFNLSRFVQSVQPKIPKRNHVLSPQRLIFADTSVRSRPVVPAVPFDASLASPFSHFRFTSLLDLASPEEGLRNPLDLSHSLKHRDGFTLDQGIGLWLQYTSSSLKSTSAKPRAIISYDDIRKTK